MTATSGGSRRKRPTKAEREQQAALAARKRRRLKVGLVAALIVVLLAAEIVDGFSLGGLIGGGSGSQAHAITDPDDPLASFYAREVLYWRSDILRWAREYRVNPNVIAIVIQIESCGGAEAISGAGAVGLMQVMPFHFDYGENMLNPDTNVGRGMDVFYECLTQFADWDLGLALACYNGGPSVTQRAFSSWAPETQYYYTWATGLWDEVAEGKRSSATLDDWLDAGGALLCTQAARTLYATSDTPTG